MYPSEPVATLINREFITARFHIKEHSKTFERFNVLWTPTVLVVDDQGQERHRIEGFLPIEDFRTQLVLGLAKVAFAAGRWGDAEAGFRRLVRDQPQSDAAAEALYWAGVSKYKATQDGSALAETGQQLKARYPDSLWAKKGSVWAA